MTQSGGTDLAALGVSYYTSELPLSNIVSLPGLATDTCTIAESVMKEIQPSGEIYKAEYEPQGLVPLFGYVYSSYQVATIDTPVKSIADMKGLRLRSAGGINGAGIETAGATAITLSTSEIYQSLERGTIDGVSFPYSSLASYSLNEVLNYGTTNVPMGTNMAVEVISEEIWQGLDKETRDAMTEAGKETTAHACSRVDDVAEEHKAQFEKEGIELLELDEPALKEWTERMEPVHKQWLESNKGNDAAQSIYDRFTKAAEL